MEIFNLFEKESGTLEIEVFSHDTSDLIFPIYFCGDFCELPF
jgi:hypothetical protein